MFLKLHFAASFSVIYIYIYIYIVKVTLSSARCETVSQRAEVRVTLTVIVQRLRY